jgi:hypothetical protein
MLKIKSECDKAEMQRRTGHGWAVVGNWSDLWGGSIPSLLQRNFREHGLLIATTAHLLVI